MVALVVTYRGRQGGHPESEDPGKELLERFEDLRSAVPNYKTIHTKGSRLNGP